MSQSFSHMIYHDTWGGAGAGNGSWADFPYYGSEKFWFIEDNTILATGNDISGTIDPSRVADGLSGTTIFNQCAPGGHGTEGGGCAANDAIKSIITHSAGHASTAAIPIALAA